MNNFERNAKKLIGQHAKNKRGVLHQLSSKLTKGQMKTVGPVVKRIDRKFLAEKADLIRDTLAEIYQNRNSTQNKLLQRNVWSSLDAIAMHLDAVGFTKVFQKLAVTLFKGSPLDHPELLALETGLMHSYLDLPEHASLRDELVTKENIERVIKFAEKEKSGRAGLRYIGGKEFTFQRAMATACGRPDTILELHLGIIKTIINILIFVINIIVLPIPVPPFNIAVAVATIIVGFIVLGLSC